MPCGGTGGSVDSLYRAGRDAVMRGHHQEGAWLREKVAREHPEAAIVGDATYWAAFAHYRIGGEAQLLIAQRLLTERRSRYPRERMYADAPALEAVVVGSLARLGNQVAMQQLLRVAKVEGACDAAAPEPLTMYLDALADVDPVRAFATIRHILERADCPASLRRNSLLVLARLQPRTSLPLLLRVARTDADPETRRSAVYWLSRVSGNDAVAALDSVARTSGDTLLWRAALAALIDGPAPQGREALRRLATSDRVPSRVRREAMMLLMERARPEDISATRDLLPKIRTAAERQTAYAALAHTRGAEGIRALLSAARDTSVPAEDRRVALVLATEAGAPTREIIGFYDSASEYLLREAALAMMAQRRDAEALDQLRDVAAHEGNARLRAAAVALLAEVRGKPLPQGAKIPNDF